MFSTHDRAVRLLAELEAEHAEAAADDKELELDFSGVEHIGPSVATAFVARIFAARREASLPEAALSNMSPDVKSTINSALEGDELPQDELLVA